MVKVQEAAALRESGIKGQILNFGAFSAEDAHQLVAMRITQSVFSDAVEFLAAAAVAADKPARVQIKVDTGMSRVGVPYESAAGFIERTNDLAGVQIEGVFTTLTEEPDFDLQQIERLRSVCAQAIEGGISIGTMHAVSSSGIAQRPGTYLDLVRPGNALYGLEELPGLDLRPTPSFKTRVALVKQLQPGDTIGYHRVHTVDSDMRLATLPIGYADGYPPRAVDKAEVLIRGSRWPVIGYISANHSLVDVTGSDIKEGDEAVLFGTQSDATISLGELAAWSDMSVYQLATGLSPMLPRVFFT